MPIPEILNRALKDAERVLPSNANRHYRNLVSYYSANLFGYMAARSENQNNNYQPFEENDPYSIEKVIDFVTHHFPLSECIRAMPTYMILDEIKDIAWEIEGCVLETITYIVNELDANPHIMLQYADLPSVVRYQAQLHLDDQLIDLGVPMDHVYVRPFIIGLLAHRWRLFAITLESPSSPTD